MYSRDAAGRDMASRPIKAGLSTGECLQVPLHDQGLQGLQGGIGMDGRGPRQKNKAWSRC